MVVLPIQLSHLGATCQRIAKKANVVKDLSDLIVKRRFLKEEQALIYNLSLNKSINVMSSGLNFKLTLLYSHFCS